MTAQADNEVATAKPSATIVVLRAARSSPQLLMVKRRAGDAFGDSFAFPGGVVDPDESTATDLGTGLSLPDANRTLDIDANGLDYYCAGIRELFEETGVLLARDSSGSWANCDAKINALRRKVDQGSLPWGEFLTKNDLQMDFAALHYFSHWETPLIQPKRWTTRFFAAELPAGQHACHDGTETIDSRWLQAEDALRQNSAGRIKLPHPTIKTLESFRGLRTVAEIIAWTAAQQAAGIRMRRLKLLPRPGPT